MLFPRSSLVAGLIHLTTLSALAQAPNPAPALRAPRPAPVISPEISSDRKVTFRLQAAKATEVSVNGQWPDGRAAMSKGTNNIWSVTVGPLPTGVWEYSFNVDGLTMVDPGNPAIKPMRSPRTSILHIVGDSPQPYDFQDVPHGVVRQHTYRSKSLGRLRELAVYTPPGYDQHTSRRYPTLYLQHGSGDNQATWVAHGKAHWIFDNLIAAKRATPMIVVMMDGHAATGGGPDGIQNNTKAFERDLLEEVMPFVERSYRVKSGAANRGIVGLSMGGGQSLTIGLNHADKFAWVGGFSAGVPSKEAVGTTLASAEATNRKLKLLWIACGEKDFLLQRNNEFIALLKEKNVRHEWRLTEGDHSWPVWRRYLADFAPMIFH